jgi:hypothetical protein
MKRSKKKILNRRKLTIVKVLPKNGTISQQDLDKWHEIFRNHTMSVEQAMSTGEVLVENVPVAKPGEHFLTLVRVGSDEYQPSIQELEEWRQIFERASLDPNFTIFTHKDVNVEVIALDKVIAIE